MMADSFHAVLEEGNSTALCLLLARREEKADCFCSPSSGREQTKKEISRKPLQHSDKWPRVLQLW